MVRLLTSNFKNYHKEGNQKIANAFDNTNGIVNQINEYLKIKILYYLFHLIVKTWKKFWSIHNYYLMDKDYLELNLKII